MEPDSLRRAGARCSVSWKSCWTTRESVDVYTLEKLTDAEFGHTLALVMAGEILDFLDTPKEMVVLTELGRHFLLRGYRQTARRSSANRC